MIGNDIIDLNYARIHNNWRRRGFLQKAFLVSEQQLIMDSEEPDKIVWTLWSMKESVYKASLREGTQRKFNPRAFLCNLTSVTKGTVIFKERIYWTRSEHKDDLIHTRAILENVHIDLYMDLINIPASKSQSEEVYAFLLKSVSDRRKWSIASVKIKKNIMGIPELFRNDEKISTLCSISHHGAYGAFLTTY